jgi:hypothetical protein
MDKLENIKEIASYNVKNSIQKTKEKLKAYYIKMNSSVYAIITDKTRYNKLISIYISALISLIFLALDL